MPKGSFICKYKDCGKSCMQEDGYYIHSEVGRENKRAAAKAYKRSEGYKKRKEECEREKNYFKMLLIH